MLPMFPMLPILQLDKLKELHTNAISQQMTLKLINLMDLFMKKVQTKPNSLTVDALLPELTITIERLLSKLSTHLQLLHITAQSQLMELKSMSMMDLSMKMEQTKPNSWIADALLEELTLLSDLPRRLLFKAQMLQLMQQQTPLLMPLLCLLSSEMQQSQLILKSPLLLTTALLLLMVLL